MGRDRFWKLVRNGSWVFLKIGIQTAGVIDRATCRLKKWGYSQIINISAAF